MGKDIILIRTKLNKNIFLRCKALTQYFPKRKSICSPGGIYCPLAMPPMIHTHAHGVMVTETGEVIKQPSARITFIDPGLYLIFNRLTKCPSCPLHTTKGRWQLFSRTLEIHLPASFVPTSHIVTLLTVNTILDVMFFLPPLFVALCDHLSSHSLALETY